MNVEISRKHAHWIPLAALAVTMILCSGLPKALCRSNRKDRGDRNRQYWRAFARSDRCSH